MVVYTSSNTSRAHVGHSVHSRIRIFAVSHYKNTDKNSMFCEQDLEDQFKVLNQSIVQSDNRTSSLRIVFPIT